MTTATMSTPLKIAAGCAALVLLGGWLALGGPRATPAPSEAAAQGTADPSVGSPAPAEPSASSDTDGGPLDGILEEESGELTDVLSVLPGTCETAGRHNAGRLSVAAVEACVSGAEGSANLVALVRESVESPAGAEMPGDVRARWGRTLADDAHTIARATDPVTRSIDAALASGRTPPAEFRALSHLRDRLDRVRTTLNL